MLVTSNDPNNCQEEATQMKSYYWAGTIWASSLWEAVNTLNIENFDKYLLKSYACLYNKFQNKLNRITMATPGNCFIEELKKHLEVTNEQISQICNIFKRRFQILAGEFDECN